MDLEIVPSVASLYTWQAPVQFDYIIMNPPFGCDGVGTDIDHMRHAFPFLKPGGRLVSLASEGVFYRGDNKASEFRAWLESLDGDNFELPEGAFLNSDRPTSWAARVVVVDKPMNITLTPDEATDVAKRMLGIESKPQTGFNQP